MRIDARKKLTCAERFYKAIIGSSGRSVHARFLACARDWMAAVAGREHEG
jgi:hypothetical protein